MKDIERIREQLRLEAMPLSEFGKLALERSREYVTALGLLDAEVEALSDRPGCSYRPFLYIEEDFILKAKNYNCPGHGWVFVVLAESSWSIRQGDLGDTDSATVLLTQDHSSLVSILNRPGENDTKTNAWRL